MTDLARSLFLSFCVTRPRAEASEAMRGAPLPIRDRAAELALAKGFGGLFFLNVSAAGLEDVFSPEIYARLRKSRSETMKDGLAMLGRFVELSSALQDKGVRCIPLKGVSLAMHTYPDEGCRRSADLDVWIDARNFPECASALAERGYRIQTPARRGALQNHGQECTFIGEGKDEIDVHYRFFSWYGEKYVYKIDSGAMFGRVERRRWAHGEAFFLKREDELHYLFLSAAAACGAPRYLLDADAFVRAHGAGLDWDCVSTALFASPLAKTHASAAVFMKGNFDTPFPDEFFRGAATRGSKAVVVRVPGPPSVLDAAALVVLYLRWNLFKRSGLFRDYFIAHNNPVPVEFQ